MATKKETPLGGSVTINLDKLPDMPGDKDRLLLAAQTLVVNDDATYARGADLRESAQQRIRTIEAFFESDKKTSHSLWQSICTKIRTLSTPYSSVVMLVEPKMKNWRLEQERVKAETERALAAASEDVQTDLAEQARIARREGDIRTAKALEAQAREVVTDVVLPSTKPEVDNLTERRPWIGVIDKPMETIVAVAEGRVPLLHTITVRGEVREEPLLIVNPAVVTFYAKKLEREMAIPGCHAEQDLTFAGKRS